MSALKRLKKDYNEICQANLKNIYVKLVDDDLFRWQCIIYNETKFENVPLIFDLVFNTNYPKEQPSAEFITTIEGGFSKKTLANGRMKICMNILNDYNNIHTVWRREGWNSKVSVEMILVSIQDQIFDLIYRTTYYVNLARESNKIILEQLNIDKFIENYNLDKPTHEQLSTYKLNDQFYMCNISHKKLSEDGTKLGYGLYNCGTTHPIISYLDIIDYDTFLEGNVYTTTNIVIGAWLPLYISNKHPINIEETYIELNKLFVMAKLNTIKHENNKIITLFGHILNNLLIDALQYRKINRLQIHAYYSYYKLFHYIIEKNNSLKKYINEQLALYSKIKLPLSKLDLDIKYIDYNLISNLQMMLLYDTKNRWSVIKPIINAYYTSNAQIDKTYGNATYTTCLIHEQFKDKIISIDNNDIEINNLLTDTVVQEFQTIFKHMLTIT